MLSENRVVWGLLPMRLVVCRCGFWVGSFDVGLWSQIFGVVSGNPHCASGMLLAPLCMGAFDILVLKQHSVLQRYCASSASLYACFVRRLSAVFVSGCCFSGTGLRGD